MEKAFPSASVTLAVEDSLFLGGMIAMSSTTIIYKAFDDLGLRKKQFTGLVLSILILEDILAIVLMVMLSDRKSVV